VGPDLHGDRRSEEETDPYFTFALILFFAILRHATAVYVCESEPAFPVRKTGVGDLGADGIAFVLHIDDGQKPGCGVEQVEGFLLCGFDIEIISPGLGFAVSALGQILRFFQGRRVI